MRRSSYRQEGGAVGLLPTPRERQSPGRLRMTVGDRRITAEDVWTLLAVAYVAGDDRGAGPRAILGLAGAIARARLGDEDRLRASLDRLSDAGLVVESGGLHRPAADVAAFLRARAHRRGVWHDHRDLARHLGIEG